MSIRLFPVLFILAGLCADAALAGTVLPVRAIRAQSMILSDDLEASDDASIPGAVQSIEDAVGMEAKVTLYPGRPILETQIGPLAVIERNQPVRMTYAEGPLLITTEGRALDRGGVGESVRVMNLTSRQVVTGAVAADGSVKVSQ